MVEHEADSKQPLHLSNSTHWHLLQSIQIIDLPRCNDQSRGSCYTKCLDIWPQTPGCIQDATTERVASALCAFKSCQGSDLVIAMATGDVGARSCRIATHQQVVRFIAVLGLLRPQQQVESGGRRQTVDLLIVWLREEASEALQEAKRPPSDPTSCLFQGAVGAVQPEITAHRRLAAECEVRHVVALPLGAHGCAIEVGAQRTSKHIACKSITHPDAACMLCVHNRIYTTPTCCLSYARHLILHI